MCTSSASVAVLARSLLTDTPAFCHSSSLLVAYLAFTPSDSKYCIAALASDTCKRDRHTSCMSTTTRVLPRLSVLHVSACALRVCNTQKAHSLQWAHVTWFTLQLSAERQASRHVLKRSSQSASAELSRARLQISQLCASGHGNCNHSVADAFAPSSTPKHPKHPRTPPSIQHPSSINGLSGYEEHAGSHF
jgi:hypothetical protein